MAESTAEAFAWHSTASRYSVTAATPKTKLSASNTFRSVLERSMTFGVKTCQYPFCWHCRNKLSSGQWSHLSRHNPLSSFGTTPHRFASTVGLLRFTGLEVFVLQFPKDVCFYFLGSERDTSAITLKLTSSFHQVLKSDLNHYTTVHGNPITAPIP